MFDILDVYLVSAQSILSIGRSINILDTVDGTTEPVAYVKLKEQPFIVSEEVEYFTNVVTAHKLSQYKNKIHTITLEENIETWLDALIEDDISKERTIMI